MTTTAEASLPEPGTIPELYRRHDLLPTHESWYEPPAGDEPARCCLVSLIAVDREVVAPDELRDHFRTPDAIREAASMLDLEPAFILGAVYAWDGKPYKREPGGYYGELVEAAGREDEYRRGYDYGREASEACLRALEATDAADKDEA